MTGVKTYGVIRFSPTDCNGYHIHYRYDSWLYFDVYPVMDWTGPNDTSGTCYTDKEHEPDIREVFEEGKCLMKLKGSYCWRGVWEGRLYFPDQEYWSGDLSELSVLFSEFIEPWAKEFIQKIEGNHHE